jgi:hypothetical protein
MKVTSALSSMGAVYGIYFGVKKKKTFWETAGFTILFAIGGAALGSAYNTITNK